MQPAKRLQKLQAVGGPSGVGGDTGISFYSGQSSFMDASSMMETSGIGYAKQQMKAQQMALAKKQPVVPPKPPSDKLIHVSQCRNDKCPLQHIWKQQQYGLNPHDKNSKEFDQQFIPHYSCPKCLDDPPKYCSQRCFQQDWFKLHQYECTGQNPESRDSVLLSECQRIEASTPFIKDGYDESTLTPEQIKLEGIFQNISKKDLEFIQSRDANLGKGSYGEVQLAKHRATGVMVAVKKIEKRSLTSSKIKETLIREIRIQKQLNHEYICRLYTSFEDKETIYLALEYASKGNLFYLIRKEKYLSEDTAFYFFIQVCSGIYYMHKQGLIHRDIKPENILIKEGNIIKICDFGWCVQSDANQQRNTFCGTLEYMAPEMIQNKAHNHTLDIWSLGILLYELVHGRAPFTGVHPREIQEKIMRGTIRFKPGLSSEYRDLVNSILKYDTTERLPLIKVFDHPWVRNFEKKYNLSKTVAAGVKSAVAAAAAKQREREQENKKAQKAAEAKALAEAAEKQRQAELEAAEKERQRQEAIKLQQQEQEMLRKQKRQEEKKREQEELLLYQALQEAEKLHERNRQQEEKLQQEAKKDLDDTQNSSVSKSAQDPDATQVIPAKGNKQQKTASNFISPRLSEKSMKSQREQETEAKKKQMALLAIQQAQLKAQQEQLERELQDSQKESVKPPKTSEKRNLNSSISVRSNKKAMHQQASPQIITEEEPSASEPQQRSQVKAVAADPNRTGEREKEKPASNQQQLSDPSTKNSSKQEKQSVPVSTQQDFDKYESEFQVLDETDMNDEEDDSSSSEVESESDSDDGIPTVPLDKTITPATPNPNESKESPEKQEPAEVEARVSATSNEKCDESEADDDDESTGIKEEEPKEDNQDQTSNNMEEEEDKDSESEDEDDSDEDQDDDESDQEEEQEESSDEDERDKRRRQREQKKKSIKGMDPIYDSSQDERIKSGLEDSSSEEEAEQSFMQKLGGIFFFGCGGDNNKKNEKKTQS